MATDTATRSERALRCMEVWGGNNRVDASVQTFGLDAWVYSRPHGPQPTDGGDVYYLSSCASGNITRLMLADVSGHGRGAAGAAEQLRTLMRKNINQVSQRTLMSQLNEQFTGETEAGCFATALVFSFFAPSRTLEVSNAGHPAPFVFRAARGTWSPLKHCHHHTSRQLANAPLGIQESVKYRNQRTKLATGDMVICFSDAVTERVCRDGKQLGMARLETLLNQLQLDQADKAIPRLLDALDGLGQLGLDQADDDMTVLLFRAHGRRLLSMAAGVLASPFRYLTSRMGGKP